MAATARMLGVTIAGKVLYLTPSGELKVGGEGKPQPVQEVLESVPKGTARKIRKELRRVGRADLAGLAP